MTVEAVAPPETTFEYHRIHRAGRGGGWWSFLAVLVALVGFITAQVAVVVAFLLYFVVDGEDPLDALQALIEPATFAPRGMFFLLVSIAVAIPLMLGGQVLVSGIRPRFLTSVVGRIRVRWLLAMVGVSFVTLIVAVVLGSLLPTSETDTASGGGLNDITGTTIQYLAIVIVLVPFQAAAEEYIFRGLIMQGLGSIGTNLRRARIIAVLGTALIFAAFHGSQSVPIFFDRFAFGAVAAILVIRTGGLEAGIAYHVVNNWLAFGIAILFGDVSDAVSPEGGNTWDIVVSLIKSLVLLGLTLAAARAMKIETTVDRTVLAPPKAPV